MVNGPAWLDDGVADAIGKRRRELGSPTMTLDDVVARKIQGEHHIVIGGMAFDVGSFISEHPGGQHALLRNLGRDATAGFLRSHGATAHISLVALWCADIVDPPSPTKISLPSKLEMRGATLFGRGGGDSSTKPPPFLGVTSVDLKLVLGEHSPLAGPMFSLPPQDTVTHQPLLRTVHLASPCPTLLLAFLHQPLLRPISQQPASFSAASRNTCQKVQHSF